MAFIMNSLIADFLLSSILLAFLFYKFWTRNYNYWEKRGVPHLKGFFPVGSLGTNIFTRKDHLGLSDEKKYNKFKGEKYVGIYLLREPALMIRDPEVIKYILTKDFNHFVNRGNRDLARHNHDFLLLHLFNMEGNPWKRMRTKLSPTFTSGKMKLYFNLIEVVAQQLEEYLKPLAEKRSVVEVKEVIARFNTDIIATCAFGLEVNSLKNPDSEFRNIGSLIFKPTGMMRLKNIILSFAPTMFEIFKINLLDEKVSTFILNILQDTIEYRKNNNVVRNDFIDLLTKVKEKTLIVSEGDEVDGEGYHKQFHLADDKEFTLKEMAAQMFVFFFAGFETAASTTTFCLFELSKNKQIQDKVRSEIDVVIQRNGGKITYQALQELHYLDKCINETLRMYASLPLLQRQCVKTYQIPDSDLVIEKGIKVFIPTYAIHHDPEYYPDPYKFDPERFSEEAINSRHHYTHLPFGEGPRACIGKRLGIMQVKMAVVTVLKDYEVTPAPWMSDQLRIDPRVFITTPAVTVQLIINTRSS